MLTSIVWVALLATTGLSVYAFFYTDVFFQDFLVPFTGEESYAAVIEGSLFVRIPCKTINLKMFNSPIFLSNTYVMYGNSPSLSNSHEKATNVLV